MRQWQRWAVLGSAAVALACGKDTTAPAEASASGQWSGTTADQMITLKLHEISGDVSGTGTYTGGFGTSTFTVVDGSYSKQATSYYLSLTLTSSSAGAPVQFFCRTTGSNSCSGSAIFQGGGLVAFDLQR